MLLGTPKSTSRQFQVSTFFLDVIHNKPLLFVTNMIGVEKRTHPPLERETFGSIPESFKLGWLLPTAHHHCDISLKEAVLPDAITRL